VFKRTLSTISYNLEASKNLIYISQCTSHICVYLSEGKIVLDADQLEFNIGSSESILCSLENETRHIRWFNNKHQEVNSTSETMQTTKTGELTIKNIQLSDGGTYECRGLEYIRYYTIYVNGRPTYFYLVEYH